MNEIRKIYGRFRLAFAENEERGEISAGYLPALVRKKACEEFIRRRVNNILDIGCGEGLFLVKLLRRTDFRLTGLDLNKKLLIRARKRCGYTRRSELILYDGRKMPFKQESFEGISILNVIMSLTEKDTETLLYEAGRLLRSNGILVTDYRNRFNVLNVLRYRLVPFLDPTIDFDIRSYTLAEMKKIIEEAGLVFEKHIPLPVFFGRFFAPAGLVVARKK